MQNLKHKPILCMYIRIVKFKRSDCSESITCVFITAFAVVNVMASEDFTAYQPDELESLNHE